MSGLVLNLLKLYVPLILWGGFGLLLGYKLPNQIGLYLGKFLFWLGVPLSIFAFLRQTDLSESIWIAPGVAWVAMLCGIGLAWLWISITLRLDPTATLKQSPFPWKKPQQGSFLLAAMVGNTGYLGYPVTLAVVGQQYLGWAIFYDTLGSTLGAYGLGVLLGARFGMVTPSAGQLIQAIVINPALWGFGLGLLCRSLVFPPAVETSLAWFAWGTIALALLLLGMRLSQLQSWHSVRLATIGLGIKMLLVPLLLGLGLTGLGVGGAPRLVMVLQMAMPPAFATLVIAEAYNLDRDLTVTCLAIGSVGLLFTLPIWLILFPY